jgi:TM2 domain-containing membrane protein YozV
MAKEEQEGPSRMTCALLAILLPAFAIHKFMLGQSTTGIIQILLCCVCAGPIISVIEGIIYLTKTDEEFYQTYVVEKKAWF